jgi:hypothetical protein
MKIQITINFGHIVLIVPFVIGKLCLLDGKQSNKFENNEFTILKE